MQEITELLVDSWDDDSVIIHRDELPKFILTAIASQLQRLDNTIDVVHTNQLVDTADNADELDRLGRQVGAIRYDDEGNEDFRQRIKLHYAAALSDGTYGAFEKALDKFLDVENNNVDISIANGRPTIIVETILNAFDAIPYTIKESTELLTDTLQSNHGVQLKACGESTLDEWVDAESIDTATTITEVSIYGGPLTINAETTIDNTTFIVDDCMNADGISQWIQAT